MKYIVNTSYGNDSIYSNEICDTLKEAKLLCKKLGLPYDAIKKCADNSLFN